MKRQAGYNYEDEYDRDLEDEEEEEDEMEEYTLENLPAFSKIAVQIRVLNKYYVGPPSQVEYFKTQESRKSAFKRKLQSFREHPFVQKRNIALHIKLRSVTVKNSIVLTWTTERIYFSDLYIITQKTCQCFQGKWHPTCYLNNYICFAFRAWSSTYI